jgi:hypothetical protein
MAVPDCKPMPESHDGYWQRQVEFAKSLEDAKSRGYVYRPTIRIEMSGIYRGYYLYVGSSVPTDDGGRIIIEFTGYFVYYI